MKTDFSQDLLEDPAMATSEAVIRKCVHCGFCTATCPTYALLGDELDSPRGRIYLIKDMLENQRKPSAKIVKHIDRCLSCLSCMTTCPSDVNYMHLIDHARSYIEDTYRRPFKDRVLRWLLASILPFPRRFRGALMLGALFKPLAPFLTKVAPLKAVGAMLALIPEKIPASVPTPNHDTGQRGTVALLAGCAEPVLRPEFRQAAIRVLDRAGFDVVSAPGEGCCGALVHHMGREHEAMAAARHNVDVWTRLIAERHITAIIMTASGCGTTIKNYGFMLRNDPAYAGKAEVVSAIAKDICEFLVDVDLPRARATTLRVAYHPSCSLQHGQRVTDAPKALLTRAGFTVRVPVDAHLCCGSAGVYNLLQPDIANQLGDLKVANLERLDADVIATGNIGCAVQIGTRASLPIVHTIELIDWASGGPEPAQFSLSNRT